MKRAFHGLSLIASCASVLHAAPLNAAIPQLKLEREVMLMRHGIRPPTKAQPIPARYSPSAWPRWRAGPGLLTNHGAKGIALLASADRAYFIKAGLVPATGCPASGQVTIRASKVPRAIDTAKVWAASLMPSCHLAVEHPAKGAPDSLFHILDDQPAWFNGHRAYEAALAQAPSGGLAAQARELFPQTERLAAILGCAPPACGLGKDPTSIVERPHGRPALHGPLDAASTASESLLLEYLEDKPMSEVGWGRVERDEIERLLVFNAIMFNYVDRPRFIARTAAGPLARAILHALSAATAAPVTLFAGHDTNIADLGGLLDLHWHVASYPADTVPPGSALGFELLSDGHGGRFVRAFFRSQTMDQLRNLEVLTTGKPPYRAYLEIPGCGRAADVLSCDLPTFTRLVEARLR